MRNQSRGITLSIMKYLYKKVYDIFNKGLYYNFASLSYIEMSITFKKKACHMGVNHDRSKLPAFGNVSWGESGGSRTT